MKTNKSDLDLFTKPMFKKLFFPAVISALGFAFADMADAIVVGTKLKAEGLAAIAIILPVYMLNAVISNAFGSGGSIKYANLLSKGYIADAREHFSATVKTSMLFALVTCILGNIFINPLLRILGTVASDGLLFIYAKNYLRILLFATPFYYLFYILNYYLRNDSLENYASIGSVIGNISDIGLSILFVIVFNIGTTGAALATLLGYIITSAIYFYAIFKRSRVMKFVRYNKDHISLAFDSFKIGFSTSVQYLYSLIFFLIVNNILMRIAGDIGVAIFDLLQNCGYLIYYLYEAAAKAMQPLLSTYVGEANEKGRLNTIRFGGMYGGLIGLITILVIEICPRLMCILFGVDPLAEGEIALRIFCVGAIFGGLNILICSYYQACESSKAAYIIETLRGFVLLLPAALICSNLSLNSFWLMYPITEAGTFFIFLIWNKIKEFEIPTEDPERVLQLLVSADADSLIDVSQQIGDFCEKYDASSKNIYFTTLTVEEVGMAILLYGIKNQKDGYIQFTVIVKENGEIRLNMRDNAPTYNPFSMKMQGDLKDDDANLDALGIEMVKNKATFFSYRQFNGFNSLVIYL